MTPAARVLTLSTACSAIVAYGVCRDSERLLSFPLLLAFSTVYPLLTAVVGAGAARLIHPLAGESPVCLRHLIRGAAAASALLAPAALFLYRYSALAAVPAAAATAILVVSLRVHAPPRVEEQYAGGWSLAGTIAGGETLLLPQPKMQHCLLAALFLQSGVVSALVGESWLATAGAVMTTGTLAQIWDLIPSRRQSRTCRDTNGIAPGLLLVLTYAMIMTGWALYPHLWRASLRTSPFPEVAADSQPFESALSARAAAPSDQDVHQGIILYPEQEKQTILVPPLPSMRLDSLGQRLSSPLNIPFFGVYWVYRPPHRRPPPRSLVLKGNPAFRNLHSNDRVPLKMEARQNLGTYIDLACCSAVQVVATTADIYPNTVGIELSIRDSAVRESSPVSLGQVLVPHPARSGRYGEKLSSVTLNYPLSPNDLPLRRFDEIVAVYKVASLRADRAPKVGIERFIFVPR